ncbi:unnamed protein product [Kuraishia capsulata CBS 1993]|uniref:Uncharacterized protein n=1 Tax=Kuraishia capsulata CBS 1993 TaxID=1382522 RepID=W6MTU8_9ASCO|nr:uncharacterized protein KUCA_T00001222001 [Kuraishia capsulata CBS 1993]CDK25255.1 unnamed protein product [Kuraishia capsulata CBS 1993]
MDFSNYKNYPIEQINSETVGSNIEIFQKILKNASNPFAGKLSSELFVEHETQIALQKRVPWHQFYILDPANGEVVSAFRIIYHRGNNGYTNLLVSFVHTKAEYRKRGFIDYLISECIKKYETVGSYEFSVPGSNNKDTDDFIKKHIKPSEKYFWTLYSAVQTFYARFGFVPFRDMNWLTYKAEEVSTYTIDDVKTGFRDTTVELIAFDEDVVKFFADPDYASYVNDSLNDENVRSMSLDNPTFYTCHNRDLCVAELHHKELKNTGLRLKHSNGKESFVIVSGDLHHEELVIHKLFTNLDVATESELLDDDLDRIQKFLHVIFDEYPFRELGFVKGYTFAVTTADLHAKDPDTQSYIIEKLQGNDWSLDTSNTKFLAMMKDYAKDGVAEGTVWLNNGFWCFG